MPATCPNCTREVAGDTAYCPYCGVALAEAGTGETFHCATCDAEYQGSDACPACGTLREPVPCAEHPERTATGRCVVCGLAVCDDCRPGDTRACLCDQHHEVVVMQGWAQVYTTPTEYEAQLVVENLRAEGIDAQPYSQKDSIFTVEIGDLSIVRVLVPVWEYAQALRIIEAHMDTEGEVTFACPSCGEPYEPGTRECTGCGAALVS